MREFSMRRLSVRVLSTNVTNFGPIITSGKNGVEGGSTSTVRMPTENAVAVSEYPPSPRFLRSHFCDSKLSQELRILRTFPEFGMVYRLTTRQELHPQAQGVYVPTLPAVETCGGNTYAQLILTGCTHGSCRQRDWHRYSEPRTKV